VVATPDDVEQVRALAAVHAIPAERIFLMAEGRDSATLRARQIWLADLCMQHGYSLTDRLHIHLSGDTRDMSDAPADTAPPMARLRGDLTQGPILKTLLAFSIPTLISNLLQTLNGTINSIWVGRLIGNSALAATANVNIVMFLTMAAVFGFGMATTVRVGQHFGARDIPAARATFGTGVGFCLMISVVVGLLGWLLAAPLLDALGTPGESRNEALDYLTVTFLTLPLGTLSIMVAMGLRGIGNSRLPLYAMILTVAIDVAMNRC
jgi:Na+-driven multidrug efflux pump